MPTLGNLAEPLEPGTFEAYVSGVFGVQPGVYFVGDELVHYVSVTQITSIGTRIIIERSWPSRRHDRGELFTLIESGESLELDAANNIIGGTGGGGGGSPTGPAGGDLSGTYPNPNVAAIHETGGPTQLVVGTINNGEFLKRVGGTVVGATVTSGDNISVNGVAANDADFDDATPAAPAGGLNVLWQKDAGTPNNLSAYVKFGTSLEVSAGALVRSALTGDVTAAAGSNATTIANDAVTYAKMQNISATQRLLGRNTAGAGDTEEVTATQALDWIGATQGQILYRGAANWTALAPGTLGQVLQTNGAAANPSWVDPAGGGTPTSGLTHQQVMSRVSLGI